MPLDQWIWLNASIDWLNWLWYHYFWLSFLSFDIHSTSYSTFSLIQWVSLYLAHIIYHLHHFHSECSYYLYSYQTLVWECLNYLDSNSRVDIDCQHTWTYCQVVFYNVDSLNMESLLFLLEWDDSQSLSKIE